MTVRVYILPIERNAGGNARGPKYFSWRYDPDPPGIDCPWSMKDYGLVDFAVLAADIADADHAAVAANADVMALPLNLDNTLTAGAVSTAQNFLEGFNIPANWITGGQTYKSVLRTVTGMFLFMQRVTAIRGQPVPFQSISLSTQVNSLPQAWRDAMAQAASEMGYDYSWVTGTTTLRQILKGMADAWGNTPILFGSLLTL